MNRTTKKVFGIILFVIFIIINLMHIYWPIHLILEDISWGTMEGTGIEMGYLYPLMVELISIHFIIAEIIYFLVFKKVKYIFIPNIVAFGFYIFQVVVFYILLSF